MHQSFSMMWMALNAYKLLRSAWTKSSDSPILHNLGSGYASIRCMLHLVYLTCCILTHLVLYAVAVLSSFVSSDCQMQSGLSWNTCSSIFAQLFRQTRQAICLLVIFQSSHLINHLILCLSRNSASEWGKLNIFPSFILPCRFPFLQIFVQSSWVTQVIFDDHLSMYPETPVETAQECVM